ncbi:MAG: MarR family transcriptional regulator [Clostridia bacterium]|nr:MarR family transcriptional regulator [Clostridia bacterium]
MRNTEALENGKDTLARLLLMTNKLRIIGDRALDGEMTIRQWLLTLAVAQYGDIPPTLSEVAEIMGTSHQNVKQLALRLHKQGFLKIEKDKVDQRATCLVLTEKSCLFWEKRQIEIRHFLTELFKDFSSEDINAMDEYLRKLYKSLQKIGEERK